MLLQVELPPASVLAQAVPCACNAFPTPPPQLTVSKPLLFLRSKLKHQQSLLSPQTRSSPVLCTQEGVCRAAPLKKQAAILPLLQGKASSEAIWKILLRERFNPSPQFIYLFNHLISTVSWIFIFTLGRDPIILHVFSCSNHSDFDHQERFQLAPRPLHLLSAWWEEVGLICFSTALPSASESHHGQLVCSSPGSTMAPSPKSSCACWWVNLEANIRGEWARCYGGVIAQGHLGWQSKRLCMGTGYT